jgi:hypothetical protein
MRLNGSDADESPIHQGSDSPQYDEMRSWLALRLYPQGCSDCP